MTSVVPLLEGKRIVICAGSGGVGKTTTSAALALGTRLPSRSPASTPVPLAAARTAAPSASDVSSSLRR